MDGHGAKRGRGGVDSFIVGRKAASIDFLWSVRFNGEILGAIFLILNPDRNLTLI